MPARLRDHLGRLVDAHGVRTDGGYFGGQVPRAAAKIEDAFARLRREQLDNPFALLPNEGVLIVVKLSVPRGDHLTPSFHLKSATPLKQDPPIVYRTMGESA